MQDSEKLTNEEEAILAAYRKRSEDDFLLFVGGLKIQYGGAKGGAMFHRVAADFQNECFNELAPYLQALREGDKPDTRRFWIERTKKASKDADLAAIVTWLCAFPRRPFLGEIGAADTEQAAIIHNRVSALLEYNKWLLDYVELISSPFAIRSREKRGDGRSLAVVNILASDSTGGAHGSTPDLLILNELTHIRSKWEFVEDCLNNADGVPDGIVIVATNAGYKGTKAEIMRKEAIESKHWQSFIYNRPAPWHDEAVLEDAQKRNTRSAFRRLWLGEWVSGKGDALDEDDIDRCFCLKGPSEVEAGWDYVAGLDLGISHDHSGLVVLGSNRALRKIKLAYMRKWEPTKGRDVDLGSVQSTCIDVWQRYRLRCLMFDPTEAKLMSQQLKGRGVPMVEMSFSKTTNLDKMATALIQVVEEGSLQCYDDYEGTLRRDFGKFHILEKKYGYRLEAVRDEFGHADVGTALVIALPQAIELMGGMHGNLRPEDDLICDDSVSLTQEEIDDMPELLRGVYDMEAEDNREHLLEKMDFMLD